MLKFPLKLKVRKKLHEVFFLSSWSNYVPRFTLFPREVSRDPLWRISDLFELMSSLLLRLEGRRSDLRESLRDHGNLNKDPAPPSRDQASTVRKSHYTITYLRIPSLLAPFSVARELLT